MEWWETPSISGAWLKWIDRTTHPKSSPDSHRRWRLRFQNDGKLKPQFFGQQKIPQCFGKIMLAELSLFSLGFSQISWEKTFFCPRYKGRWGKHDPSGRSNLEISSSSFWTRFRSKILWKRSNKVKAQFFCSQTATSTIVISKACPAALSLALSEEHQARLDCVPQVKTQMRPSEKHWQRHCGIPFEHWTTDFSKETKTL